METRPLNPHDRLFRFAFADLALVRDFVAHYLPAEISAEVDVDSLAPVEGTFIDETLNQHLSDALFRVDLRHHEGESLIYILIEHKSYADRMTARQVLRYIERIWSQEERANPQKTSLTPILPVVLYHGATTWNVTTELLDLIDVPVSFDAYMPRLRFLLWDLREVDTTRLVGTVQLRLFVRLIELFQADDIMERIPELGALLRELTEPKTVLDWVRVGLTYLSANARMRQEDVLEIARLLVPVDDEEGEAIMSSIAEVWFRDGLEKGREEGREEGAARLLLHLVHHRFGEIPKYATEQMQHLSLTQAEALVDAVLASESLDQFLAQLPPRPEA